MNEAAHPPVDLLTPTRALVDGGDFLGVVRLLEGLSRDRLLAEPELGYHFAYACRRTGRPSEAGELVAALDVPARRAAVEWLVRRRANLEAMLRYDRGDLEGALRGWEEVVELAGASHDHELLAAAQNNLGVVYTLEDRFDAALAAYQRALLASRRLGDRRGMAQAHQNLAILHRELGRPEKADEHFEQALREARLSRSEDVRGRAEEERALLQLEAGDVPLARATALRALARLSAIDDASGRGEALRVLGIIALRERHLPAAREHLDSALEIARRIGHPLLEAETLEALAVLSDLEGGAEPAREYRATATERFTAIRASGWGSRVRVRTEAFAGTS